MINKISTLKTYQKVCIFNRTYYPLPKKQNKKQKIKHNEKTKKQQQQKKKGERERGKNKGKEKERTRSSRVSKKSISPYFSRYLSIALSKAIS